MTYKTRQEIATMANLDELFSKAYSANDLILFHEPFQHGTDHGIAANPIRSNPGGKILKRHRVAMLQEVFLDNKLALIFYNKQTDLCRKVIDHIVWYGDQTILTLEVLLKKKVAKKNLSSRSQWEPFLLKDGLELLLMEALPYRGYRNYRDAATKDETLLFLPKLLAKKLREVIAKPAAYYITPLKNKAPATAINHCSESTVLKELPILIQFIKLGHLPLKKNGLATVKGLREIAKAAALQEFYPSSGNSPLKQLKSSLLTTFLLHIDLDSNPASSKKPQDLLRNIFGQWLKSKKFTFIEQLLDHLRIARNRYDFWNLNKTANIKDNLRLILKEMPKNGWVSLEKIHSFATVRQINLLEFDKKILEFRHQEDIEGYDFNLEEWESINSQKIKHVIHLPLLKSFFFLAAALGLVEIDYNIPKNPYYKRLKREYLTSYDGLQLVKLTPLGAYVSGKTKKYTSNIKEESCKLHLDKTRLLLIMTGSDPIADFNLQQLMEPAGTGRYMLTYPSLLKNCQTKQDIKKKIELFKKTTSQTTPKIWHDFFKTAMARVDPLTIEPGVRVFKIAQDQELMNILTSDHDISPLILKVEGLRVAVELSNLNKLTHLLRAHGYLINKNRLLLAG